MPQNDIGPHWRDIPASYGLLTRLPIPVDSDWAMARGAHGAWAYPLVGLGLGLMAMLCMWIAGAFGLPAAMGAALTLALVIFVTGALHEDGLADTFDGLWGGWDRERRLTIMKDSQIGTYGVIALGLTLLVRWHGLTLLLQSGQLWLVVPVLMASRAVMPVMMQLPHARQGGLSASVGHPPLWAAFLSAAIGIAVLMTLSGASLPALVVLGIMNVKLWFLAKSKIGGQTGDILGASQQLCEVCLWLVIGSAFFGVA